MTDRAGEFLNWEVEEERERAETERVEQEQQQAQARDDLRCIDTLTAAVRP